VVEARWLTAGEEAVKQAAATLGIDLDPHTGRCLFTQEEKQRLIAALSAAGANTVSILTAPVEAGTGRDSKNVYEHRYSDQVVFESDGSIHPGKTYRMDLGQILNVLGAEGVHSDGPATFSVTFRAIKLVGDLAYK